MKQFLKQPEGILCVLDRASIAIIKHLDQNQLGEERIYFIL